MSDARWRPLVLTAALWLWWSAIHFPRIYTDVEIGAPPNFGLYQVFGYGVYVAAAVALYPVRVCRGPTRFEMPQTALIVLFLGALVLQFHGDAAAILAGIGYTATFIIAVAALSVLWTLDVDDQAICFTGAAVLICLFGVSALVVHGLPNGRDLGGIHPNTVGASMLSGFVLSQFRTGFLTVVTRVLCLLIAGLVSSRFSLIGSTIAFVICELIEKPVNPKLAAVVVAGVVIFALFGHQIIEVLALDDPARNLDSGISGRDESWASAFKMITEAPQGAGFKRSDNMDAGHNGYLKMYVELGIFGGTMVILALFGAFGLAIGRAARVPPSHARLRRIAAARAAGIGAYMFATFFEPQMFNFGDTHGVMFMLLLFVPVEAFARGGDNRRPAACAGETRLASRSDATGRPAPAACASSSCLGGIIRP